MKYINTIFVFLVVFFFTSCISVTGGHEQHFSYNAGDIQLPDLLFRDEYKLPYPKDAFETALQFFQSKFKKRHLAIDGPMKISLFNDSVWQVVCPVRYHLYSKKRSESGLGKSSTLLISRKDGDILYFTFFKKRHLEKSQDDFLAWTPWPTTMYYYADIINRLLKEEFPLPPDTLSILLDDCTDIDGYRIKDFEKRYPIRIKCSTPTPTTWRGDFYKMGKVIVAENNCRFEINVAKGHFDYDDGNCKVVLGRQVVYVYELKGSKYKFKFKKAAYKSL